MTDLAFTVIQPANLDPTKFLISPQGIVGFAPTVGNYTDTQYTTSANVSGETALMFMPGQFVEACDPTIQFIYCGVSLTAALSGAPVVARRQGIMASTLWNWTPDAPIFVGPAGSLTQMAPTSGWSRIIGYALDAQTIFLAPEHLIQIEGIS